MILAELWVKFLGDATDLQKKTEAARKDIEKFGRDMESVGQRLAIAVSLPLVAGAIAAAKVAGEMEQNAVAFTTLLKSADAAKVHLEALQAFALKTPFQFPELVKSSRLMQAMGFSVGKVIPMMTTLGNAVSAMGGGNDMLQRIILSFGQMQARGKLTGEELRELAHANVPALALVATKLGITTAQAMKQMEAGGISAKVAMAAILEYMETRFKGGMEAQSQTMLGMWSNVRDKITFTLADIGKAMLPMAKDVITNYINPLLDKVRELAGEFSKLPFAVQKGTIATGALVAAAPLAIWGLGSLAINATALWKVLVPLASSIATVAYAVSTGMTGALMGMEVVLLGLAKYAAPILAIAWALKKVNDEAEKVGKIPVTTGNVGVPSATGWYTQARLSELKPPRDMAGLNQVQNLAAGTRGIEMWGAALETAANAGANAAVALDKAWKAVSLKDLRKELKDMVAGYSELRKAGVLSLADIWKAESEIGKLQQKIGDRELGLTGEKPKPRQFELDPLMEARIKGEGKSLQELASEIVKLEQASRDWNAATIGSVRPLTESQRALKVLLDETVGATGGLLSLSEAQDTLSKTQGPMNRGLEDAAKEMDKYAAALAGLGMEKKGRNVGGWLKTLDELSSRFQGAEADAQRLAFAMELSGLAKSRDQVEKLAWAMDELNRQNDGSIESWRRSMLATIAWTDAAVEAGDTIDREWLQQIEKLRAALGKKPPTAWAEAMRQMGREISTAFSDMAKNISEIIWPRGGTTEPAWVATQKKAVDALKSAYEGLAGRGYNDPKKALEEIIARIKGAGSAAEANAIAIKNFGASGVEMAAMIRNGTLNTEQFAEALKVATGEMVKLSAETQSKAKGIASVFEEVARAVLRSILTIVIEQGLLKLMKVLGLVKKDVKTLEDAFGALIGKIGRALADWLGFSKKVAESAIPTISGGGGGGGTGTTVGGIPTNVGGGVMTVGTINAQWLNVQNLTGGGGSGKTLPPSGGGGTTSPSGAGPLGWITAMSTLTSAITDLINVFQLWTMNRTLDLIEQQVRYSQIHLLTILEKANLTWPKLIDLMDYNWNVQMPYLQKITAALEGGGAGGSATYNITVNAPSGDSRAIVESIKSYLSTRSPVFV